MRVIFILFRYIKYWLTATRRHQIHSPFVFDLINNVFRDRTKYEDCQVLHQFRRELSRSKDPIETVDFGAGSGDNLYRTIIYPLGMLIRRRSPHKKRLELLYRLSKNIKPKTILEFGTGAGVSATYLNKGNPSAMMITMEGCAGLANVAEENFQKLNLQVEDVVIGDFKVILPGVLGRFSELEFVFFDGNHRKNPTFSYFNQCVPLVNQNSIFVFDDIHWSQGMQEAWKEIQQDPRVSITIDLFWFGLVFFKEGVAKQNFRIVY